ncbi:hypothetical protein LCGC14_2782930 [marine sediment metagenome]|uniref:DUF1922 domain-containing protein n=1 Tax=marine sediment metagenome TaxID=412755 RepID=A0A0F8ZEW7_9ZZZZ
MTKMKHQEEKKLKNTKINYNRIAWQCPECKHWSYIRGRAGMKLSKCLKCNISVKVISKQERIETYEHIIKSVEFIRKGKKRLSSRGYLVGGE